MMDVTDFFFSEGTEYGIIINEMKNDPGSETDRKNV